MSGIQEITLIGVVILAILFLPRLISGDKPNRPKRPFFKLPKIRISGRIRLAIVVSFLWLLISSAVLKPWNHKFLVFVYVGIAPVILGWSIKWVILGFKKAEVEKNQEP